MQLIRHILGSLHRSAFLRQNAVMLAGSIVVGVANYAYYPVLGRMLEPTVYGEVQAVVALFLQLTIFLIVLTQVTVNVVANYTDEARKQQVVFELERLAALGAVALVAAGIIFSWQLKAFFHFTSVWPFIISLLVFAVSVPLAFRAAYLRAYQRFGLTSVVNLIGALGKVALSALFVVLGFQAAGAIGGILVAQLLAFGYAAYQARTLGWHRPEGARYVARPAFKLVMPELKYALFVGMVTSAVTLLASVDVFVVKHYFDPHTAGEYAGMSTVARIVFFLTASIALVLLPSVRVHNSAQANRALLYKSLLLTLGVGGLACLPLAVMPDRILGMLMGADYTAYAHLLPELGLAMLFISFVNVLGAYYMALRAYQIIPALLMGLAVAITFLVLGHDTLEAVVMSLLYGSASMLGLCVLWSAFRHMRAPG